MVSATSARLDLLAGAHVAGVITRLGAGGVEAPYATAEPRGDRHFEPMRERLPAELVVAAEIAAHRLIRLTVDFGLEQAIRSDHAVQQLDRAIRVGRRRQ